jgi:hypothetical protein
VTLFDTATGAIIDSNDDSNATLDSFLIHNLAAGNYIATLTVYNNFPVGPLLKDGFQGTIFSDFFNSDAHWALDILNMDSASIGVPYISAVIPEPESYAMMLAGLGLLGWRLRLGD